MLACVVTYVLVGSLNAVLFASPPLHSPQPRPCDWVETYQIHTDAGLTLIVNITDNGLLVWQGRSSAVGGHTLVAGRERVRVSISLVSTPLPTRIS